MSSLSFQQDKSEDHMTDRLESDRTAESHSIIQKNMIQVGTSIMIERMKKRGADKIALTVVEIVIWFWNDHH